MAGRFIGVTASFHLRGAEDRMLQMDGAHSQHLKADELVSRVADGGQEQCKSIGVDNPLYVKVMVSFLF